MSPSAECQTATDVPVQQDKDAAIASVLKYGNANLTDVSALGLDTLQSDLQWVLRSMRLTSEDKDSVTVIVPQRVSTWIQRHLAEGLESKFSTGILRLVPISL
mmetsp:Transcript_7557/g.14821  ORF Transcript_7557/g.14821 Transcript_7557/m.14821 type:complete len:103 (-) Transcript_7557:24-332(-)